MACGCCSGGTGIARSALIQACVVAFIGIVVGAIHSSREPVQLRVDTKALDTTTITLPAKPDTKSATSNTGTAPRDAAAPTDTVTPGTGNSTPPPAASAQPQQVTLGLEITVDQAFALFQMGTPFLDARHDNEFNAGHVLNAIRMTSDEFLPRAGEVMRFMPGPVVIYCTGGDCDASHNLAKALQQAGFTKLHIMKDGYPAWAAAHPELVVKP